MSIFTKLLSAGFGMLALCLTAQAEVRLHGGGATFPAPIYERWVAEYQKLHPEVKVDYQAIGSGGGIKGITEKTFDFAGSDAAMSRKEIARAGGPDTLVEFPTIAGAVVLIYNLQGFQGDLKLDGPTIADIYLGNIKMWNDARIGALNPNAVLPAIPITTVHRTDASGTNFIFTSYLCAQNGNFKNNVGAGKAVAWPNGVGAPQGINLAVRQINGAIGYVELAYAVENKIPFAQLKNKDGKFVKATAESVSLAGEAAAENLKGNILTANIWDQPREKTYPICSFTYMIIYKDLGYLKDPAKAKALADFLRWATADGEKIAAESDYAPLGAGVQKKVEQALAELTYDGKPLSPIAK